MPARSPNRGFTLIEIMAAVAILGILMALAATAMVYGLGRARVNNTLFDISALFSVAQLRAVSTGTHHYVVIYNNAENGRVRAALIERPDNGPEVEWDNLDLSNGPGHALEFNEYDPVAQVYNLRPAYERDALTFATSSGPDTGGIRFLDLDSRDRLPENLPPPFNAIVVSTPDHTAEEGLNQPTSNLLAGCSFCIDSGSSEYGVIGFFPNGTVRLMTPSDADPPPAGGVISFMTNTTDASDVGHRLLVIAAPSGAVRVF